MERAKHLERLAAKKGVRRNDLLRSLADKAIADDAEGRDPLGDNPIVRVEPKDIPQVLAALTTGLMEFDRIAKHVVKVDADNHRKAAADTAKVSEARAAIVDDVKVDNQRVLDAVLAAIEAAKVDVMAKVEQVRGALEAAIDDFRNALAHDLDTLPQLREINAKLDRVEAFAAQPRKETKIQVADGYFSVPGLLGLLGVMLLPAGILFAVIAKLFPVVGTPYGVGILGGGDTAICTTIRAEYANTRECAVKSTASAVIATATIPRNRR